MNVGQTPLTARACDPNWEYVGFEPNPRSWLAASELVAANGFGHCALLPVGLSDKTALASYLSNSLTDKSGSTIDDYRDPAKHTYRYKQYVSVVRGEEALHEVGVGEIGVLKVDVEGAEKEVLQGQSSVIERDRPLIIIEVLPVYEAGTPTGKVRLERQTAIENLMAQSIYCMVRVEPPAGLRPNVESGVHGDLALSNYVLCPDEKQGTMMDADVEQRFSVLV